jgi:hypothetical protein
LATLNDPQYVEAARVLAERLMKQAPGDTGTQIATAYRLCTSQQVSEKQRAVLQELMADQKAHYQKQPKAAEELLAIGETKRNTALAAADHAALTATVLALFNYDPFVTKR